ncbi:MAG: carboxypeptidase regulatory-like domain-containing protein [Chloracidobacterium sp.]|nr:carboxypeptidase regulatory-like domain-containing protein [Chloracidobacterium sp.]
MEASLTGTQSSAEQPVEPIKVKTKEEKSKSKYEMSLKVEEFWNDRLTYPTGRFDPKWLREAVQQDAQVERAVPAGIQIAAENRAASPLALDPNSFTALGPKPKRMTGCAGCYDYGVTQGRVNAIAIDPTTTTQGSIVAYIASNGGGVWKTTNCCSAATTWTSMTDDPLVSTTGVGTLAIDPNNHDTIYAGTGDLRFGSFSMGSQGILKSTDAGATWTVLGASVFGPAYTQPAGQFPQYDAVGKVRVDPNNSNRVVAGTKKGIFLSYDGGTNWTGPCATNSFSTQRQDTTGLELSNMGGGVTRIVAAVGPRGFATTVQVDLNQNGANGLYKSTVPASGCPTDWTLISRNDNGFVFGNDPGSPYPSGALLNAGSGTAYANSTTGNQLGRIDIAVAPSNANYIYAQVSSITTQSSCGAAGCQLGVWSSIDGGTTWSFMTGSSGPSLRDCDTGGTASTGSSVEGSGDYNQNWYDQGLVVDPNDPDRIFMDTYDTWLATRTGSAFYNVTCGYTGTALSNHVVHVDHHALAFVNGSSDILLEGSDGGIFSTSNASAAANDTLRPTWVNMVTGMNTIEFYSGDISGNFATSSTPQAVGGAQDNGASSVTFSGGAPTAIQWQMGLGGDGFSGMINSVGQGTTAAQGAVTVTGAGTIGQTFNIAGQIFTWASTRAGTGQVSVGTSSTTAATNIRSAVNADVSSIAYATGSASSVTINATVQGAGGNSIQFVNGNSANLSFNGSGTLGATTQGGMTQTGTNQSVFFQGNNSGGLSRCVNNCTNSGSLWQSVQGGWTGDTQSFILPVNLFRGGIPGGNDCVNGCGRLLAATTRVFETVTANANATNSVFWYITNNPTTQNLTKGTLGNRSFITQVKYSPKFQSVAIVGTNDGNVQIGFNLGTGVANQGNWINVTGSNAVLPNRPILGVALSPGVPAANVPVGYAAVGGFNLNTPTTPGHVFQVSCTALCASFTWLDKSGNLPNIPVDSIIVNPNFPQQVFAGTDFGLYFTNDITAASPQWFRFSNGLPAVMIWDMSIDRGSTTLSLWTRGRGAFAWPLPLGPIGTPSVTPTATPTTAPTATATNTATNTPTFTPTSTSTNTQTNTPTPTATSTALPASPTPSPSINGTVTYGNSNSGTKFISNATVASTVGSPSISAVTDAPGATAGQYVLTGFGPGNYTIGVTKTTGQNGVSSLDAARIAQQVAGILNLTSDNQRATADVSNNGAISSNDAALIARFAAGIGAPIGNTNQWRFYVSPGPTFPVGSSPTTRSYVEPIGVQTGQDYVGLLIGDVTGNWTPTSAKPTSSTGRSVDIGLPRISAPTDTEVLIPVSINGASNKKIIAYEFDLRYDPTVIQPQTEPIDLTGTASRGLFAVTNIVEPGLLRVVMYGAYPIDSNALLLNLKFTAVGAPGSVSPLTWERVMFNEVESGTLTTNGAVELLASTPNEAELTGRVLSATGQGIPNARVILTDNTTGFTRSTVSNGFGYYKFDNLQLGQTNTINVESRGWAFAPLTISVTDQLLSLDMIAAQ